MATIPYKNKDGKRVQGVTTIISNNLGWNHGPIMYWAWKEGMEGRDYKETTKKAADAGTLAHELIEMDLKGELYKPDDCLMFDFLLDKSEDMARKATTAYSNFLHWKEDTHLTVVSLEEHLVSEKYQFGATPDCIAMINFKRCLFDWKTSNGVYAEYLIQIAAYKQAWEEVHPNLPIDGGYYLYRMDKENASWTLHYWENLDSAWEVFKALLILRDLKKSIKP
jgi:hypothetical protein